MKEETTLRQDIKTMWTDGCKGLVGWLASFGQPKTNPALEKEMRLMYTKEKPKRARGPKGRYKGDDKSTPDVNEAWVGGKAPKRGKK